MAQFMVQVGHSLDDCVDYLDKMQENRPDLMQQMQWGCMVGEHNGWTVVEADNMAQVRSMLPEDMRDSARIAEVNQFSVDEIRSRGEIQD